ncbi:hypothetical protein EUGRSUZ_F02575 [Eucalyptus grandis]|uniref:Cysteine-rich transmembrane domain-containing protein n=2 Tax=Eucalyptus grandis TaxID=71139 RepID=A0A059BSE6_EUCGR|nr:hypothetical protein EUGRSUZ_F02575 [Eucalyptus grandis]
MEGAPSPQEMSYYDHVTKRREEKGCLYACFFTLCCCFCCYESLDILLSNNCHVNGLIKNCSIIMERQ